MIAGYKDVSFMFEPEAAALASGPLDPGALGLIIDIGGGTSDFSVFERDGDATRIIASHGVRVGGTDFDRAISIAEVMPLFGRVPRCAMPWGPAVMLPQMRFSMIWRLGRKSPLCIPLKTVGWWRILQN